MLLPLHELIVVEQLVKPEQLPIVWAFAMGVPPLQYPALVIRHGDPGVPAPVTAPWNCIAQFVTATLIASVPQDQVAPTVPIIAVLSVQSTAASGVAFRTLLFPHCQQGGCKVVC